ncbi:sugar phosphate isomerase/epimerase [Streptomyces sp. NP160]|uniref:sugar phosphate isomerase/epimerase family protein n=1 Tax=Streptomyces sp. NP160 TaxID=2586637 RepID=UPI00214C0537|nr:sugar phosphate isomerase/epimerase [Streptomyces sp. NP160]
MSTTPTPAGQTADSRASSQVSVQLYTVREALADDVAGTVARLAALGFASVEPFGPLALSDELASALAEHDIAAPTMHQRFVGSDDDALDALFAAAAARGTRTVIDPFTPPDRWGTREDVEAVAAELAAAAAVAARHGVRVGYHNHAHELQSVLDATTAFEVLAQRLAEVAPEVVLEVDTYWVAVGGQDPVALLQRLGDQVVALHLKDGPATADVLDQVALGRGSLPVAEIVAAAPSALRVIELDDSRGDRFTAVADGLAHLRAEGLA